jgi:2-polyprenyl-3-methyl-5-hydroxy-6-metoxy-1,4-benzoquinol methylase
MEIKGANEEVDFWKEFVKTDRFLKDWLSDSVTTELQSGQSEVVDIIQYFITGNPEVKVLDLGSGVYSILKGLVLQENLYGSDILRDQYDEIFDYVGNGLRSPMKVAVEELNSVGSYDIVHMRNALDHSSDPKKGIENIKRAVKRGGVAIVHGFVDEAINENWKGMHQWNLHLDGNKLICTGKKGVLFSEESNFFNLTKTLETGKKWFIWVWQK